jgi:deoxyadenosine/deoxycytidine kinase
MDVVLLTRTRLSSHISSMNRPTINLCVDGNIGVGKSSVLSTIKNRYPNLCIVPEPVDEWASLLQCFYDDPSRYAKELQMTVLRHYQNTRELTKHEPIVLWERSPVSARFMFTELLYNQHLLTPDEYDTICSAFDTMGWTPVQCMYLRCHPDIAYAHIQNRTPPNPGDYLITASYIQQLHDQYEIGMMQYPLLNIIDGNNPMHTVLADVVHWITPLVEHIHPPPI